MEIITYPHPILRYKSKPIKRVDTELRQMIGQMFELMYEAHGVGLAANQVNLPLRVFVVNTEADPAKGQELVFINPVISKPKGLDEQEEGCLSLPQVHAKVRRPARVHITAYDLQGNAIDTTLDGFLARVVQHELDHLDGVLLIDRVSETSQMDLADLLDEFETDFSSRRSTGSVPSDAALAAEWVAWERKYG